MARWVPAFAGTTPERVAVKALIRAVDAELDGLFERRLHRRVGKEGERVGGDRAVMAGALGGVLERAGVCPQGYLILEGGGGVIPLLPRGPPQPAAILCAASQP